MSLELSSIDWPTVARFLAGLGVLTALALGLQRWVSVSLGWRPFTAIARACAQLATVALLLHGVLAAPWTVALFILLMVTTASWTSAGNLRQLHRGRLAALAGVVAGAACSIGLILALRLVPWNARSLIATAGIVIGNCMTGSTLAGRNFTNLARSRRDEIEGWFALGASPPVAHQEIRQQALRESLIPNLDQTRSTGIVTLPGAFVGALMGGASPWGAAQFQLVVLAGIGLAMTVTGIVVTGVVSRATTLPPDV